MGWDRPTEQALPSHEVSHLHLLRHGVVDTGGLRRCYGQTDYPLSLEGQRQAEALANFCARHLPRPDGILSSDLSRCVETARALSEALGLPLQLESALREQHMGEWEGRSWADLTGQDINGVRAYWTDYLHARPPGGETFGEMAHRVDAFFDGRWASLRGRRWLVVSHVGPLRAISCRLLGLPLDQALRFAPLPGTHTWFQVAQAGAVLQALGERPLAQAPGAAGEARVIEAPQPQGRPPRLALSGSAGIGKTTLARALAARWGLPYIPEGMRARLESGLDLHALDHEALQALVLELWAEQKALEARALVEAGGFVADRSALDFAAFWLHYHFTADAGATSAIMAELVEHARGYDRVVLLPWGLLPLQPDGVRSSNPWVQRHFQATVEGLLHRELPLSRLGLMPPLLELEHRIAWVEDLLQETGTAGASRYPGR